ncbi:uncharacterized protein LOC131654847 [Vicia villosa]|uniref:uncharacterized protein LOC131654847 n=1 Tax=Vicia villosa TaxID=3911 RepID=UPI00273CD113|nr:uncharacterized protein LOC131654847 [Vicia villosa]
MVETRCDPSLLSKTIKKLGYDRFESSANSGFAGGIVMGWKSNEIEVHVCKKHEQFIHMKIKEDGELLSYFTVVYARPYEASKKVLREELKEISQHMCDPWMLAGDFNDIAYVSDKRGGVVPSLNRCKKLRDRMDMCNISDVEARGPVFTWRGPIFRGGQRIYEKLDRAFSNDDWRLKFHEAYVKVLMRMEFSDHHPILLSFREECCVGFDKPFRFENAWLLNDTYSTMLKETWKKETDVVENLKNVVAGIDKWKFESFDKIKRLKKIYYAEIRRHTKEIADA